MATIDGTIANSALPVLARELHATAAASVWIINGFQLAVTASVFTFASLGSLRGPSRVYRFGVALFVAGSLACALSRSLDALVVMRAIQGLGASAIMSLTPALVREVVPPQQLGRALGFNAMMVAFGSSAGPTVGGAILAVTSWPWLFGINVPLGIAAIVLSRALPHAKPARGTIDIPSSAASAVAFSALIYGIDGFARHEPPAISALEIVCGLAVGAYFVLRQRRLERPMLAVEIFRTPPFSLAAATSFASFTAQGLAYVSLPFLFQNVNGLSPFQSGLLLTSWPLAIAVIAPIAGRLSDRFPAAILSTAGLAVLAIGLALYALLPPHASTLQIVLHGIICGVGFGFFQSPNNREFIGSVPRTKVTSASAVLAAVRVSGQTFGAALVAIVFELVGNTGAAHLPHTTAIGAAIPATLWLASACAGLGTLASAIRLRGTHAETRLA